MDHAGRLVVFRSVTERMRSGLAAGDALPNSAISVGLLQRGLLWLLLIAGHPLYPIAATSPRQNEVRGEDCHRCASLLWWLAAMGGCGAPNFDVRVALSHRRSPPDARPAASC